MYHIDTNLWQGAMPTAPLQESIRAVVCLMHHDDECAPPWHLYGGCAAVLWLPIYDGPFPGVGWLERSVRMVTEVEPLGCLIHCRGGVSRSVFLAAACLMKWHGWSTDVALETIAVVNRGLNPAPAFEAGLREWGRALAGRAEG